MQDLYSRKIIAHKISRHMTADLVISTFQQAFETRKTTNKLNCAYRSWVASTAVLALNRS
ncbi:hypothetical protein [Pediococcus damnosus]|uniref:hypothetical protein n=1 Tax=Pediococcus damnosus TaxID=51663 RepID=UPI0034545585